jgi:hypothetical protein
MGLMRPRSGDRKEHLAPCLFLMKGALHQSKGIKTHSLVTLEINLS